MADVEGDAQAGDGRAASDTKGGVVQLTPSSDTHWPRIRRWMLIGAVIAVAMEVLRGSKHPWTGEGLLYNSAHAAA